MSPVKKHRVLVLVHKNLVPKDVPASEVDPAWRMEWDVVTTLRRRPAAEGSGLMRLVTTVGTKATLARI